MNKDPSIIYSLSQCNISNGVIQFKSHTPQSSISLNSLSHDLAYIKPGFKVPALFGKSKQSIESNQLVGWTTGKIRVYDYTSNC